LRSRLNLSLDDIVEGLRRCVKLDLSRAPWWQAVLS